MFFLVDDRKKILFGWSAKCGCSHIKNIYWFLQNGKINNKIHIKCEYNELPENTEDYTIIIICRNPYKRLVSGFLDKYKKEGQFRHEWENKKLSFNDFVNELIKKEWTMVNKHHFTPQTTEFFDKTKLLKNIKVYDIGNIDYEYIEKLYDKKIPDCILKKKEGHERKKYNKTINECVYDLHIDDYLEYNVDLKYFYNQDIKKKVNNFFINDFNFFKEYGIDYEEEFLKMI